MVDDIEAQRITGALVLRFYLTSQFVLPPGHGVETPVREEQDLIEVDGLHIGLQFQPAFGRQLAIEYLVEFPDPALLFPSSRECFQSLTGIGLGPAGVLERSRAGDDLLFQVFPLSDQCFDLTDPRGRSLFVKPFQTVLQSLLSGLQFDFCFFRRVERFAGVLQCICHRFLFFSQFLQHLVCFLQGLIGQFPLRFFQFLPEGLFLSGQIGDRRLQLTEFFGTCLIGTLPFRQVFLQFLKSVHLLLQVFTGGFQFRLEHPVLFQLCL